MIGSAERKRLVGDVAGAMLGLVLLGLVVVLDWGYATLICEKRLRLCVVANRPLGGGRVLQKGDFAIRLRRPEVVMPAEQSEEPDYYNSVTLLESRQLSEPLTPNSIIYGSMIAQPSSLRREAVEFVLPLDKTNSMALNKDARIILIPQGAPTTPRSWPEFTVVDCIDPAKAGSTETTIPLRLRAESTGDAMQVVAASGSTVKLVPLVVASGTPCTSPPTQPTKGKTKTKKS